MQWHTNENDDGFSLVYIYKTIQWNTNTVCIQNYFYYKVK